MKKLVAAVLCLIMLLSLISCGAVNKIKNTENDIAVTEATDKNSATKDSETTDTPTTVINKQYYKIEKIELTKVRYYIYDSDGNTVLSDETDRPIEISLHGDNIVDICISMGTGINIHKYYDVQNNRFSEEYSYVATSSGTLVAYIEGTSLSDRTLVIRDIFDKNAFYKSFGLDFSSTVHDPIESATFTDGEAELNLVYLSERQPVSLSITLPIRRASDEEVSWQKKITSEEALQIASEYWGTEDGFTDYGAGSMWVCHIILLDDRSSVENGYYHIGLQVDHYGRDGNDLRVLHNDSSMEHLFVNSVTGECQEYVPVYGNGVPVYGKG